MEKARWKGKNPDLWIPLLLYGLLLAFKLAFAINLRSEPQVFDEFTYVRLARTLAAEGSYNSVHYPLLYPLFLSAALVLGDHAYLGMKILNAAASSFVPVLMYAVARLYMEPKKSVIPAAFSAVIPFQYAMASMIMSENLFFPLLMLAVYMVLRPRRRAALGDAALGALLGAMYLTRFVTLVMIPVFALAWLMREFQEKRSLPSLLARGVLLSLCALFVFAPWFFMCRSYGHSLKNILGFSIASKTNPEQLTKRRLLMVAGYYVCYFGLILGPVIGLVFKSFRALKLKASELFGGYNRLWCLVCGLAAATFTAVVRHSWRASYNYPAFDHINGRYLIYFSALFVLLGTVVLLEEKPRFKHGWINLLFTYALPVGLFAAGYLVHVEGITGVETPVNGYGLDWKMLCTAGPAYSAVTGVFVLAYQYLHDFARPERRKHLLLAYGAGLVLLEAAGAPAYISYLSNRNASQNEKANRYAAELCEVLEDLDLKEEIYLYAEKMPSYTHIKYMVGFRELDQVKLVKEKEDVADTVYYVFTDDPMAYADSTLETAAEFVWGDSAYSLLKVQD